jgi:general secretion pathway protein G
LFQIELKKGINMKKTKKRSITLLEIMIVIFLIGLIGSVIGFNMKGSMDKGRVFKTERAQQQIKDILELQLASGGVTTDQVIQDPAHYLELSGMVKDPAKLILDGWNEPFEIVQGEQPHEILVNSSRLKAYQDKEAAKANGKKE